MPVDYHGLGKRIAQYRNRKGLTQEQLGEAVHIINTHISRAERAKRRLSLDTIVDIANVLDVTSDMLLQDSLVHTDSSFYHEVAEALGECSELERKILLRILKELKDVLQDFNI